MVWISFGLVLPAQEPVTGGADWRGVVRNAAGNPLSGAAIELISASGQKNVSVTQPDGAFRFSHLLPGPFTLFVTVDGHRIAYPQPIELAARDVILTLTGQGALSLQAVAEESETSGGVALSSHAVSGL